MYVALKPFWLVWSHHLNYPKLVRLVFFVSVLMILSARQICSAQPHPDAKNQAQIRICLLSRIPDPIRTRLMIFPILYPRLLIHFRSLLLALYFGVFSLKEIQIKFLGLKKIKKPTYQVEYLHHLSYPK